MAHDVPLWRSHVRRRRPRVDAPSDTMRRDTLEVLYPIGEAVIIISAIVATFIVAALAFYVLVP